MVRLARTDDVWKTVFRRKYAHSIKSIDLKGVGGINDVEIENGIFAICGLNGAGKSTIIAALKDILGLKVNNQDLKKVNGNNLVAQIMSNDELLEVSNKEELRFADFRNEEASIYYLDYKQSINALDFLEQDNLEELLEQYEENILSVDLLKDINYIVGKDYDEVILVEIDDGDDIIPFFKVKISDIEYDSLGMGMGEHFLFYIFWVFYRIKGSGIILIEEPETFISINSQQKLMNFIAKKASKLGITVILASHSPYIVKRIKKENIIILSRYLNYVSITKPSIDEESMMSLGLEIPQKGSIFVEDKIAEIFLKIILSRHLSYILRDYSIEYVRGHAGITERLMFPKSEKFSYKIIGIYDGDMIEDIERIKDNLNWKYSFLPTKDAIEIEFNKCLRENLGQFADSIEMNQAQIIHILSNIAGEDHHDWLLELARKSGKDIVLLLEKLYDFWISDEENQNKVQEFLNELEQFC
jgi:predicted ATPase